MIIYTQEPESREDTFVLYADLKLTLKDTNRGVILGWFDNYYNAHQYMNQLQIEIERVYICRETDPSQGNSENTFIIYTNLKLTPGYGIPGIPLKWFKTRNEAEDYLKIIRIEVHRIYINQLEPLHLKTFSELRRR